MRSYLAHLFCAILPGTLLLAAAVVAPWDWASTWPLGIFYLNVLLLSAAGFWALGLLLRFRRPELSWWLVGLVALLLAQGWGMTLNAHFFANTDTGLLIPLDEAVGWLPGSINRDASQPAMLRLTALLLAALVTAHLGRDPLWRRALIYGMALSGVSIALLGVVQRITQAPDIFWSDQRHLVLFFATFINVTHAGAYLNFCLPLAAAALLLALVKQHGSGAVAGWLCAAAVLLASAFVVGSKIAPLFALVLLFLFLLLHYRFWLPLLAETHWPVLLGYLLVVVLALSAIAYSFGFSMLARRFDPELQDPNNYSTIFVRLHAYEISARGIPDAGVLGLGPGTFATAFPYYNYAEGANALGGRWLAAHEDYLQTYLEWGPWGSALWSIYFFGAMLLLGRGRRDGAERWRTEDRIQAGGLLLALFGLAALSLGDFPLQMAALQFYAALAVGLGWSSLFWPRWRVKARKTAGNESTES